MITPPGHMQNENAPGTPFRSFARRTYSAAGSRVARSPYWLLSMSACGCSMRRPIWKGLKPSATPRSRSIWYAGSNLGFGGDGGPATVAQFLGPLGAGLDAAGDVFIADTANNRIRRVDAVTRVVTTIVT